MLANILLPLTVYCASFGYQDLELNCQITDGLGWKDLKDKLVPTLYCAQEHLLLNEVVEGPIQPGLELQHRLVNSSFSKQQPVPMLHNPLSKR